MKRAPEIGRRLFLCATTTSGAALVIGCHVAPPPEPAAPAPSSSGPTPQAAATAPAPFAPNAWVRVTGDGTVTVIVHKAEMGQGVQTAIPMLIAEELEVDLSKVKTEFAPVDAVYKNKVFGTQATGGSTTVRSEYVPLRKAGAAARMMLVAAAAKSWGVDELACLAKNGEVVHAASGRKAGYGDLVAKAAALPIPADPPLKDKSALRLLGTPAPRLDALEKATGRAVFGIDVREPGMLVAVVVRPRVFGAKMTRFDGAKALAMKGVHKVFPIDGGVAVVADAYWQAYEGAQAVVVEWSEGAIAEQSSARIAQKCAELAKEAGKVAEQAGDADKALAAAGKRALEAVYEVPYQAHVPMEPLNCAAHVRKDGCDVWVSTQTAEGVQKTAAKVTGLPLSSIRVHSTYCGGGFGRRFEQDFITDGIQIAKEMGVPVKVVWTREDDITHDFYRPATWNLLRGAIGKDGAVLAWTHRIVGPSIMSRVFPNQVKGGLDRSSLEGATELPYAIANLRVDYHLLDTGVPVGFWRSVGHSQNAFVTECFFDELAALGKQDPLELRRRLMTKEPRLKAALELAATKGDWGKRLGPNKGRGIACAASFGSFAAHVAEVEVGSDGAVHVRRIVCAIDCGAIVNPDIIAAQLEGAVAYGLSGALEAEITIEKGGVVQSNFHDYPLLRIADMPRVEVHIVPSADKPGGVGEPGTPPVAPAVVNALFAATGKRIRKLPIKRASS
jgi:isoquinoline 1-oxidoreductase beta subunit